MAKQEIKYGHIVPYLPHGLMMHNIHNGKTFELKGVYDTGDYSIHNLVYVFKGEATHFDLLKVNFKPLLIPMGELNKQAPRTVTGIRRIDEINSKSTYYITYKFGETFFGDLPEHMPVEDVWDTYENLFAGHYDIFDGIGNGWALNKLDYPL